MRISDELNLFVSNPVFENKLYGAAENGSNNSRGQKAPAFSITPKGIGNHQQSDLINLRPIGPQSATNKNSSKFQFDPSTVSRSKIMIAPNFSPQHASPKTLSFGDPFTLSNQKEVEIEQKVPVLVGIKKKSKIKELTINTDNINDETNFGGEQGYRLPK